MKQAITTTNEAWGFFGTTVSNEGASTEQAAADFNEAALAVVEALEITTSEARELLDSRLGRHIADARLANETARELFLRTIAAWPRYFDRTLAEIRSEKGAK